MKKTLPIIFFSVFAFIGLNGQNTYDTYFNPPCIYPALDPADGITPITGKVFSGYTGEYQIFLDKYPPIGIYGHPWVYSSTLNSNTITYKIEVVSFPFTPNCYSCQTFFGTTGSRIYKMPDDKFPYVSGQNAWVRDTTGLPAAPAGQVNDLILQREFAGIYDDPSSSFVQDNIRYSTLVSKFIAQSGPEYHIDERILYPHSVLKHTFYMHCGDETKPVVDSFSFVLDHTRGRMRHYPFEGTNSTTYENEHDVAIFPTWYLRSGAVSLNTIDYFPMLQTPSNCQSHIPEVGSSLDDFIRPEPGTLLQVLLGSHLGQSAAGTLSDHTPQPGIQHEYIIDRTFDLNILNPSEKIIYNPSDVSINLNQPYNTTPESKVLTFPSGYTFKTVNGIYPTVIQVEAGDPQNLYYHPKDIISENTLPVSCDDVGANDGYFSYYRVKSGSTLIIEPCVRLYDVRIEVETGAELFYNSEELTGRHYEIVSTGLGVGGIIHNASHPVLSFSNCPFNCYNNAKFDIVGEYEITTNKTWTPSNILAELDASLDGRIEIGGTIIIRSGNTVTINGGVKLAFGETGKIVIEPNAKLIVNGVAGSEAIFTSIEFCENSMWEGIQVLGVSTNSQGTNPVATTTQGFLYLHRAKIENARTAIKIGREGDILSHGGVVNATLTTFSNNYIDAEFAPYDNYIGSPTSIINYASIFNNCIFETTRKLNDPYYAAAGNRPIAADKHIILNGVKRVKINNCLFVNSATALGLPLFDADVRGTGIYSIDSDVDLKEASLSNTFKNLSVGFHAISTPTLRYINIVGNHFIGNIHGIILEGTQLSKINSNDFTVPASPSNPILAANPVTRGYNKPVGLYLIGATDFTAEENVFTNDGEVTTSDISTDLYNYGMVVNNCSGSVIAKTGPSTGYVYKNSFTNFNINLQSELDNKGGFGSGSGLIYSCNDFNTRINKDVTVVGNSTNFGYLRDQGLCAFSEDQAGNNYTSCISGSFDQLEFDTDALTAVSNFYYSDQPFKFDCTNFPGADNECLPVLGFNTCPSNLISCSSISCLTVSFDDAQLASKLILASYKQLIDGGNTSFLINKINSSMSAGQLKSLLISKSPYLSDEVLIATLNRADLPPYGHLEQIFIANSPVTQPVISELQNTGLPSGVLNNIMSAQTGISARVEKESELDYYLFQAKLALVKLKQAYLEIENIDSIKAISKRDTTLSGLYNLVAVLIDKGDYAEAHDYLNEIHVKEGAIPSDRYEINGIRLNLAENNKSWLNMDSIQSNTIAQIYGNNVETSIHARNILSITKGVKHSRYPYDISSNERSMFTNSESDITEETSDGMLINYPNPFSGETTIKAVLPENESCGEIIITDIIGRLIAAYKLENGTTTISFQTNGMQNAIYFYYMTNAYGVKIKSNKMILTK